MTDVQQLTHTLPASTPLGRPAPRRPRRPHRLAWWVLATIVLGSLIGSSLAVLAGSMSAREGQVASAEGTTSTTPGLGLSIPPGLITGKADVKPPIHSIDNRVFVVGDSVMQGAAPHLGELLEGWSLIADTRVGRFIDEANRVIAKRRKDIGMIAVLNLGNNYNGNELQFAQQVDAALAQLTGVPHVIWINVAEFKDDRVEVNRVVQRAASTYPNLTVVDWNSWWEKDRSLTAGDRLHLSPAGGEAYAALVSSAVLQVTEAAGEIPAPGAKPPKLNTSGRIPASSSGSSSGSSSKSSSSRRTTRTTAAPPVTQAPSSPDPTPVVTSPPATSPPAPATTAPAEPTPPSTP